MDELRREIMQSEASIIDLMKWKLILVGGIGAVGLGLTNEASAKTPEVSALILCVIPFACNYVDALCKSLEIKICKLRTVLAHVGDELAKDPEEKLFVGYAFGRDCDIGGDALRLFRIFTLEELVLTFSTATINLGLIFYAIIFLSQRQFVIISAVAGFLFMIYVETVYRIHLKRISRPRSEGR
jgi:hypothetical protein